MGLASVEWFCNCPKRHSMSCSELLRAAPEVMPYAQEEKGLIGLEWAILESFDLLS